MCIYIIKKFRYEDHSKQVERTLGDISTVPMFCSGSFVDQLIKTQMGIFRMMHDEPPNSPAVSCSPPGEWEVYIRFLGDSSRATAANLGITNIFYIVTANDRPYSL